MTRIIASGLLAIGLLGTAAYAQTHAGAVGERQWAVVTITTPTVVGRAILMGTYLVVHDDARMAKGQPCTTFYEFDPATGRQKEVLSFLCLRGQQAAPEATTLSLGHDPVLGIPTLTAYQFAGDTETHGVPAGLR